MSKNIGYLEDKSGNTLLPTIVNTITNSNGTALQLSDGTMICYGSKSFTVTCNQSVGNIFYTAQVSLGNYPANFIDTPVLMIGGGTGALNYIEHNYSGGSSLGYCWFWNPTSRPQATIRVGFLAIGKWK